MGRAPALDDILHSFGQDTLSYPHEFDLQAEFPAFSQVFELALSDSVSARWSKGEWREVIGAIMNNDTTGTADDVFGIVWPYFVRDGKDLDPSYAGVEFVADITYTRIRLRLYDSADVPDPCPSGYDDVCRGWSFYGNTNEITVNASSPKMSVNEVLGLGIAHELQHLCFKISGWGGSYDSVNETMSTLAEYFLDSWRPHEYDLSYGAGVIRPEHCEPWSRYDTEKIWITYLYEVFKGDPGVADDDLVHRWRDSGLGLNGLAATLWGESDYSWLGGVDETGRLAALGADFLIAKFCNAPSLGSHGEFGLGPLNTVRDFALFLDNCTYYGVYNGTIVAPMRPVDCPDNTIDALQIYQAANQGCWNVRVLLPSFELGEAHDNAWSLVSGIYTNGDDTPSIMEPDSSSDYIDVAVMGTDYIIFRPGEYFDDGRVHDLHLRLRGTSGHVSSYFPEAYRVKPIGAVITYASNEDTLQVHPEDIQSVEPLAFSPATITTDTTATSFVVRDFGGAAQAVVLAVGLMPSGSSTWLGGDNNWFVYEYDYGVSTAEVAAFTRVDSDTVLNAQPGTPAAGCPQGDGDDVVVTVALDAAFYDGPIAKSDFSVTVPDTAVLYAAVEADSDATLIDGKYRTTITLSQFGGCGAGDLTVLLNGNRIGTAAVDMRSPDMIANGAVIASDFARFGIAYPSPPKPYDACADYRAVLGEVTTGDFTYFGTHFNHNSSGGAMPATAAAEATGALRLDVQEEYSLAGGRRVWGTLSVENVEPFRALVVALHTDNPRFRFVAWHPDPSYPAMTMGTEVVRDGQRQAFVGILGSAAALSTTPLGKVEFEIMDDEPLALSDDDLSFLVADLQAVEGGLRSLSPLRLERAETPPAYHFELGQNVPNPFNPLTTIAYSLASDSDVSLVVYDVRGARVKTLVSGHTRAGVQRVQWDGVDDRGSRVSSGVYFYRLVAGSFRDTKKMVLLK